MTDLQFCFKSQIVQHNCNIYCTYMNCQYVTEYLTKYRYAAYTI